MQVSGAYWVVCQDMKDRETNRDGKARTGYMSMGDTEHDLPCNISDVTVDDSHIARRIVQPGGRATW